MSELAPIHVYIDTCSFQKLRFNPDITLLLTASKKRIIKLHVSEVLVWERGKHHHDSEIKNERIIPHRASFWRYFAWYKKLFEQYDVCVIKTQKEHLHKVSSFLNNSEFYFKEKDQRDALVLSVVVNILDRDTLIITDDDNLRAAFIQEGYANCKKIDSLFNDLRNKVGCNISIQLPEINEIEDSQLSSVFSDAFWEFIPSADPEPFIKHLKTLPTRKDKLKAFLESLHPTDDKIRERILGYVKWFEPILKIDLDNLLMKQGYPLSVIDNHVQLLKQNGLLDETTHYWIASNIPDSIDIFEQAMSSIMNEIIEIMELS